MKGIGIGIGRDKGREGGHKKAKNNGKSEGEGKKGGKENAKGKNNLSPGSCQGFDRCCNIRSYCHKSKKDCWLRGKGQTDHKVNSIERQRTTTQRESGRQHKCKSARSREYEFHVTEETT